MKRFLTELFGSAVAVAFFASLAHATCPQPLYIIAHRCNDVGDVYNVVDQQGVNAIEADVRTKAAGPYDQWWVDHDFVHPLSTHLHDWLNDVRNAIDEKPGLALIIFDVKTPGSNLLSLYTQVRAALGEDINLIFSIGEYPDAAWTYFLQDGFKQALNMDPRAGSSIDCLYSSSDEDQYLVQDLFESTGVRDYWFADGWSAGAIEPGSVESNVKTGMLLRDMPLLLCNVDAPFRGVYTWTYESEDRIKAYLRKSMDFFQVAGVNGIFMNSTECFEFVDWFGAWEGHEAVAWVKSNRSQTGTQFADRAYNPFKVPAPKITKCPTSTTVECSTSGGVDRYDPQLDAFFKGTEVDTWCDDVGDAEIDTPAFFHVNETAGVTFTVADNDGCRPSDSCEANVTVVDTIPPTITDITAMPDTLWPPNGKMVPVTLKVTGADVCDSTPACQITSVTSNEPGSAVPGDRWPDWKIIGAAGLELRAERLGKGNGRVYTITVECADASGNRSQGTVEIGVPHDRGLQTTARLR